MADKVANALGAPEVAGTLVNPKGLMKKSTSRVAGREAAGLVGSVAAGFATGDQGAPDLPAFGRVGYVAVSESDVVLLKTKAAKLGLEMAPTEEVLARVPRRELESVEFDEAKMVSHLRLRFANDRLWEFDIPRAGRKKGKAFAKALQG